MKDDDRRWVEVTPSQFTHEAEGLRLVREFLPSAPPYRAWSNFEFRDSQGRWHEVDLLVLGRGRLHLVELKYYRGLLSGDDHRWVRDRRRAEDSPLLLAHRKAQRLASLLRETFWEWARENPHVAVPHPRKVVPFVQESVFLHHPDLRCVLPAASRKDLFGLEEHERTSGLPGLATRLLETPTGEAISENRSRIIAALMQRRGIVPRRQREAGSWVIDEEPLAEGDGWQDWPAFHRVTTTTRGRIRFTLTPPGAAAEQQVRERRRAEREFAVLSRLAHDAILRPLDLVEAELGVGLVYPEDDRQRRLDLWLAEQQGEVTAAQQVEVLRQVAEAVGYAHRHRVVHRGLLPQSVWVREATDGRLRAVVSDWRSAGGLTAGSPSDSVLTGLGSEPSTDAAARLAAVARGDADSRQAGAFQAPEGLWQRNADRVRLDVFALGALAFYLLSGHPAAPDRSALRERLRAQDGLDLAADLPQVPSTLRTLVLEATRPVVADRLADVRSFLALLDKAEDALLGPDTEAATDPLEARTGTVLDDRFRVERRLGAGSTAVGLMVTDLVDDSVRVLKVALDDAAASRLADEAEVLRGLDHPRLVALVDGPLPVGNRIALVLRHAGDQTLGDVLGERRSRQSIDLLERWGTDLLDAVVELDRIGVVHRDIKPANLGVAEQRRDRAKHLVLFDFSLARAGAASTTAGTPPYLDPFLDSPGRRRYDSAAERYAAAVVLFEMATGAPPVYGDGMSDPSVVGVEATIEPAMFDPTLAPALVAFFRRALHPDSGVRFDTAGDMRGAWMAVFSPVTRGPSDDRSDAVGRADRATAGTPLTGSGLSARALSAVEPLHVATVGELLAIDRVRLNRLPGVAEATRREITEHTRAWRERLGATEPAGDPEWAGPLAPALLLRDAAGSRSATARRRAAAALLGLELDLPAFATQAELAAVLSVTPPRANQLVDRVQVAWAEHTESRDLLDALGRLLSGALNALGGVATVGELAGEVLTVLGTGGGDGPAPDRLAAGLLRVALDRIEKLRQVDPDAEPLARRRRGGRLQLIATSPELLDLADRAAARVEDLVAGRATDQPLVPAGTALRASGAMAEGAITSERLVALAAAHSTRVAVSGRGEPYDRELPVSTAVRLVLAEISGAQQWKPHEVRSRVRARFPGLPPLPTDRALLDAVLADAGLPVLFDEAAGAYRPATRPDDTTGLGTRGPTHVAPVPRNAVVAGGHAESRLVESERARSFLALGVEATRAAAAVQRLRDRHGAELVDVTRVLILAMREQAAAVGLPWDRVRAADAAVAGSRDAVGLAALVARTIGAVDDSITEATSGGGPVLLVELSPLARYGHLSTLARWTDLSLRRGQAVWALVPQLPGNTGPLVDGKPLPLSAPGQFLSLDAEWFAATSTPEGART